MEVDFKRIKLLIWGGSLMQRTYCICIECRKPTYRYRVREV